MPCEGDGLLVVKLCICCHKFVGMKLQPGRPLSLDSPEAHIEELSIDMSSPARRLLPESIGLS